MKHKEPRKSGEVEGKSVIRLALEESNRSAQGPFYELENQALNYFLPYVGSSYSGNSFEERFRQRGANAIERTGSVFAAIHARKLFNYKRNLEDLAPHAIEFCDWLLDKREKRGHGRLVFLGRDARVLSSVARRLAASRGIPSSDVRLLDFSTQLAQNASGDRLVSYVERLGILEGARHITVVDNGFRGTISEPMKQFLRYINKFKGRKARITSVLFAKSPHIKGVAAFSGESEFNSDNIDILGVRGLPGSGFMSKPAQLAFLIEEGQNVEPIEGLTDSNLPNYRKTSSEIERLKSWAKHQILRQATEEYLRRKR